MILGKVVRAVAPPVVFGVIFFGAWELIVKVFDIKPFLLPAPSAIWAEFIDRSDDILEATLVTGTNALTGLLFGVAFGIAMSFVLMRFQVANELVTPLAVALNAIPIIVLVPVFNNMFSSTTEVPRRLMVTLIVFFIVMVNVAKGLRQVSQTHLELLNSYAASPGSILLKARIPNAVPYFFTALKIAAPAAVITAFVAEYFGGRQNGLGYSITSNAAASRNAASWAYVMGACTLGLIFYLTAVVLEKATSPSKRSTTQQSGALTPGGASA